jgi:flagellar FliL protein
VGLIVVNFKQGTRTRYLQVGVNLMSKDPDGVKAATTHLPLIKNNLIMLFSGQEFEALQTPEGKEALRQSALQEVQKILQEKIGKPGIEQVLFTDFVMQ